MHYTLLTVSGTCPDLGIPLLESLGVLAMTREAGWKVLTLPHANGDFIEKVVESKPDLISFRNRTWANVGI
jgi:hypothetical protein